MGRLFLFVILMVLLSDSVISHRVRHTAVVPEEAVAVQVPASHGSVQKFDSSPALTFLQYGAPNAPKSREGPANPQSYPDFHSSAADVTGMSDYFEWHPEAHPPFLKDAAAEPTELPFGEPSSQRTELPKVTEYTIDPTQFHPTHSFFGCKFFGGCPGDADGRSPAPTGTATKATSSFTGGSSKGRDVLIADEIRLPTSAGPALAGYGNNVERGQNDTVPAPTATEAVVHNSTVSTFTRGSPPVADLQLDEVAATEGPSQRAGTLPQVTTLATEVSEGTLKPLSPPDMQRGTSMSPGMARALVITTTVDEHNSDDKELLSTTPTSETVKAVQSTQGSISSTTKQSATVPPSVPPTETVELLQRQGHEENSTEAVSSERTTESTTRTSAVRKATSEAASSNHTTVPTTPFSRQTEIATPSPTSSPSDGSATRRHPVLEKTLSMQSSVGTAQILTEATAQTSRSTATITAASPRTEATSPTAPTATTPTEANASHSAVQSVPTEPFREVTVASTTLAPDIKKHLSDTSKRPATANEATPTKSASFLQTRPPSRPVPPPVFTPRPTAPPDSYVRPITQHSTDQFVPHRDRDVEDYYAMHAPGQMEELENQRRGQCGKCQRILHNCVQKCFLRHSCEAEADIELSCPRINAPCLPPFKHEVDHCRHSADCGGANHLCCLVGCSRRCVLGVPTSHHWAPRP